MTQRIYDSRSASVRELEPREPGRIGMYVCGPTVQSAPHIGHLRSALAYDQIRRWLVASGFEVTLIRNVTDIDDKILQRSAESQATEQPEAWWALAYRVERQFNEAYDAIGVAAPTYEPRATANVQGMIDLTQRLIERGHAYQASDGSANVFFDTRSWQTYGELTRQSRDAMEPATDSEPLGKKDPRDFALWKAYRETEPRSAAWESPWGPGRPGWHIECSAMATRYLGNAFDIHGGGLDLRFPHHENELAQSAAAGDSFAKYWIHNGLVNTGGQKMSKSLGNSLFAADLLAAHRPIVLRYFLGSAQYRSVLEYSEQALDDAAAAFERIESFLTRAGHELGDRLAAPIGLFSGPEHETAPTLAQGELASVVPERFRDAMLDDFAVPQALAAVHDAVRAGNTAFDAGDVETATARARELVAMLGVLGLDPREAHWSARSPLSTHHPAVTALSSLVQGMLDERAAARAAKDFAKSDHLRDQLVAAGIEIEDTRDGARWSVQ